MTDTALQPLRADSGASLWESPGGQTPFPLEAMARLRREAFPAGVGARRC